MNSFVELEVIRNSYVQMCPSSSCSIRKQLNIMITTMKFIHILNKDVSYSSFLN